MPELAPLRLGAPVPFEALEPGRLYAVPHRDGHFIALAGQVTGEAALVLLARRDCDSLDELPAWVWPDAIPATTAHPLPDAHVEPAHASGATRPAKDSNGRPRNGDLLTDSEGRLFIHLKRKLAAEAFALDTGVAHAAFDTHATYRRWRVRQRDEQGEVRTIAEYESH